MEVLFTFLLKYCWFTMLCQFLLYSKMTQSFICIYTQFTHTYTIFFYIIFHHGLSQEIGYSFLCSSRTLLLIHSKFNSLHLLTPNSQSIPLPPPSPLATASPFQWKPLHQPPFTHATCTHTVRFSCKTCNWCSQQVKQAFSSWFCLSSVQKQNYSFYEN